MDRFIDRPKQNIYTSCAYLKSNMDRFIDRPKQNIYTSCAYLKSNMDRFIVLQSGSITPLRT